MLKTILIVVVALGAAFAAAGAAVLPDRVSGDPFEVPSATSEDLRTVAEHRIFFGHRSVGFNVLDGLPGVYEEAGLAPPDVVDSTRAPSTAGIAHTEIGENGDPLGKIANFDRIMRAGMAEAVDVAVLKLCYVDFRVGEVDVDEVFSAYRTTLAALADDFPETAFVAVTSPLTTERGPRGKVKAMLGRGDRYGPEHNVLRQRFNDLLRAEFTDAGSLFDLAAVQSTTPEGQRVAFEREGQVYYALHEDYAKDPGHLNAPGGTVAASAFVAVLADAVA